jgi:hypothetical protein
MSHAQYDPTPKAPPPWAQPAPAQGAGIARLLPVLGVVLGLLGLGLGAAAWFRAAPADVGTPVYTEQQVSEAKEAVCDAYTLGLGSLRAAGTRKPDNPAEALPTTAVNIRLAEVAVGNSLFNALAANPAAPDELSDQVNQLGNVYQRLALVHLADGSREDFYPIAAQADELIPKIDQRCYG